MNVASVHPVTVGPAAARGLLRAVEALEIAQHWLANSMPVVELEGPKPLPVIAAALAEIEETLK
jgi:hypothetical protein